MSRLIRLYPRAWRARYEAEMREVLAERPLTLAGRVDLVRAAFDAHLHPESCWTSPAPIRALTADEVRLLRMLGRATVAGALLWIAGLVIAVQGPVVADELGSYRDGAAALPFVFVAGLLLAGGLLGQVVRLADEAATSRLAAAFAAPILVLYLLAPWMLPIGVFAVGLLALHVLSAMRVRAWPGLPIDDGFPAHVAAARAFVVTLDPGRGGWTPGSDPSGEGTALNVRALSQRCPHLGCRPNPCPEDFWFRCPCHQSRYDRLGIKADGVQYGPAPHGLDRFPIEVDASGGLIVDTSRVTLGPLPVALGQPGLIPPRVPNGCV